ncbi:hypothetical protein LIER_28668 [Lithospermum erythrorhizon]|uniref:Uncharacterized protein n=1 Tax=Lithospermum erythrorhizon TaxID=34254 RepID=A0AAV3RGH4_LITER
MSLMFGLLCLDLLLQGIDLDVHIARLLPTPASLSFGLRPASSKSDLRRSSLKEKASEVSQRYQYARQLLKLQPSLSPSERRPAT